MTLFGHFFLLYTYTLHFYFSVFSLSLSLSASDDFRDPSAPYPSTQLRMFNTISNPDMHLAIPTNTRDQTYSASQDFGGHFPQPLMTFWGEDAINEWMCDVPDGTFFGYKKRM